jgi:hypothetical protein
MVHEIFNVIACGEVIPCTGQDHSPNAKVTCCLNKGSGKVCIHIPSQCIHLLGTIKREGQDAI